jgi:putative ABC transport system permease protein
MSSSHRGSPPARRAIVRWAVRLFRREWRQQILVLVLLAVAVSAAVAGGTAAYTLARGRSGASFGSADYHLRVDGSDPRALDETVAAATAWFDATDLIARRAVDVPGLFDPVELRAQDPEGQFGSSMLGLRDGRYPTDAHEVAMTDGVADDLGVDLGVAVELGDTERVVVGVVENPRDLGDEFALVAPAHLDAPASVTVLIGGSAERFEAFRGPNDAVVEVGTRASNEDLVAAVGLLGAIEVALLFVALVAATGFVVVAQRRLRQLGMLAAIGASQAHLRLVVVSNGAIVGAVAAVTGAAVGVAGWFVAAPYLGAAAGQRIDRFDMPWWLVGAATVLAVATATAAAWWPARVVAQVSTTRALSGRPPQAEPAHRSVALAVAFLALGVVCLAASGEVADDYEIYWTNALLTAVSTLAIVVGVLLLSPLGLRTLAAAARWLPVAPRVAFRDLARYQARSGVSLAAITLALGIAAAIVVSATAAEHGAAEGNLSDRQLLIRTGAQGAPFVPDWTPAGLAAARDGVDRIAAALDDPTVLALEVAMDPSVEPVRGERQVVTLAAEISGGSVDVALVYVATPELLGHQGLDRSTLRPGTELVTTETGRVSYAGARDPRTGRFPPQPTTNVEVIDESFTSLPAALITPEALRQRGWVAARAGWLLEGRDPLTDDERTAARDVAASAGLTIEARHEQGGLAQLRTAATLVGVLLAMAVLAMTTGLLRTEAGSQLRTLTANGATSRTRRALTAATTGGLCLLGVALGTGGAYLGLAAGALDDIGTLTPVLVLHLGVLIVGLPGVAAAAAWLLGGREPLAIARQAIE